MRLPPTPARLLLGLLTLLVFGNCGGGVNQFLRGLNTKQEQQLRAILAQNHQLHAAARQQLRGRTRHEENERIEDYTNARLDSLLTTNWQQRKITNRRAKVERQLRRQLRQRPG